MKNKTYYLSCFNVVSNAVIILFLFQAILPAQSPIKESKNYKVYRIVGEKAQNYIVLLPYSYDSAEAYPVLVTLHGNGGNAESMAGVFDVYAKLPLIIVIPQGQYPRTDIGFSWYLETNDKSMWEKTDRKSADYIIDVIKDVQKSYKTDDIFLLGFSQGASLAYMTGFKYPSVFRGIASIGGGLPAIDVEGSVVKTEDIKNADGLKIFVSRGKDDSLVPKRAFDYQIDFLKKNDYKVESYEYDGPHDFTVDLLQELNKWLRKYSR